MAVSAGDVAVVVAELAVIEALGPAAPAICGAVRTAIQAQMALLAVARIAEMTAQAVEQDVQIAIDAITNPGVLIAQGERVAAAAAQGALDAAYNVALSSIASRCPALG